MKPVLPILLTLLPVCAAAVPEAWVERIGWVESRNDPKAVGDGARARGELQFWECAWRDVSAIRAARGLPVYSYAFAHDQAVARSYAKTWLDEIERRLAVVLRRAPNIGEVFAAHNLGWSGFARRGFDLARCPTKTRLAAFRLSLGIQPLS